MSNYEFEKQTDEKVKSLIANKKHSSGQAVENKSMNDQVNQSQKHSSNQPVSFPLTALERGLVTTGRQAFAAEILGHLDRTSSTTAAYHLVKSLCQIELGLEPSSLGATVEKEAHNNG